MAKTLQEILAPSAISPIVSRMHSARVPNWLTSPLIRIHLLTRPNDDPHQVRTLCGSHEWYDRRGSRADPNKKPVRPVTCPACLRVLEEMGD